MIWNILLKPLLALHQSLLTLLAVSRQPGIGTGLGPWGSVSAAPQLWLESSPVLGLPPGPPASPGASAPASGPPSQPM